MSYENNYTFDEQSLYISGQYIDGVQSIQSTFSYPKADPLSLGYVTPVAQSMDGDMNGEFSATRLLVGSGDPITGFFANGASGHLRYHPDQAYIFQTGLISEYSCNCELNEVPSLDFTMQTWGKMFGSITGYGDQPGPEYNPNQEIFLPSPGDIEIDVVDCVGGHELDITTNAVRSFDYNVRIEWLPISALGSQLPSAFVVKYPIEVEAVIVIELNEFIPPNFLESLCSPIMKKITLKLNRCNTDCNATKEIIRQFVVPNGKLIDINQFSDIDDVLVAELTFSSTNTQVNGIGDLLYYEPPP